MWGEFATMRKGEFSLYKGGWFLVTATLHTISDTHTKPVDIVLDSDLWLQSARGRKTGKFKKMMSGHTNSYSRFWSVVISENQDNQIRETSHHPWGVTLDWVSAWLRQGPLVTCEGGCTASVFCHEVSCLLPLSRANMQSHNNDQPAIQGRSGLRLLEVTLETTKGTVADNPRELS